MLECFKIVNLHISRKTTKSTSKTNVQINHYLVVKYVINVITFVSLLMSDELAKNTSR